jgi:hypothetical protein
MPVLAFCHPRRLTKREIAEHVERIMVALRRMTAERAEK